MGLLEAIFPAKQRKQIYRRPTVAESRDGARAPAKLKEPLNPAIGKATQIIRTQRVKQSHKDHLVQSYLKSAVPLLQESVKFFFSDSCELRFCHLLKVRGFSLTKKKKSHVFLKGGHKFGCKFPSANANTKT